MTYAFDTLKFTQRLEQVGVGREQAEAHAELARDMILADMATKADLLTLEAAIKSELQSETAGVKSEFRSEMAGFKSELRSELSSVKSEIGAFRAEFGSSKKETDGALRELELRMIVKLGAMIAAAVAVIAALQKFL
ncbi:CCDC90 family protein [Methylobacterium sp. J-048]|uniref:CCDC90 family protein n=1 Tax=Methylobacterium sp. J-048 TaxID=2836635 RepID=UPI001FB97CD1|nr:CCDC90 family protein [Methylobacterium sp. J-048]MCJ2055445.1 CCDC90 family protein [Methylobacterium sp. J-048]